jgi:NADPH:quinone reductase-like Zn-dependent oxidoreductase
MAPMIVPTSGGPAGPVPPAMNAVLLRGHGGVEQYEYREDVPVPAPGPLDVLVEVEAASLNNTDVNVRADWYAGEVDETGLVFPRIQGADIAGRIVAEGSCVAASRVGERVICDPNLRTGVERKPERSATAGYLGFDIDGGFAQYVVVPAANAWQVPEHLPASELACYPVAYSTGLEMILRSRARMGQTVLVSGASGGVGTALIQLGKALGLDMIGIASPAKHDRLRWLGADVLIDGAAPNLVEALAKTGITSVDVVLDVVGGDPLAVLLGLVREGGTCVTAGAISGPTTPVDLRHLIYRDLDLRGVSCPRISTFAMLVDLVSRGAVNAPVAATYPLKELVAAQQKFIDKQHVGKIVLTVPPKS